MFRRGRVRVGRKRRRARRFLIGLAAYLLVYVGLSALGEYQNDFSGKRRWFGGLAWFDVALWQPRGMYFRVYIGVDGKRDVSGSPLGWIYSPLILVDRALVHPTISPFDDAG